ncbi:MULTISPECIES: TetR/AcrR family transcriptional regulator [unclassified Mycolicibacterium]|uniref:TetR/AcrR family transcriptional regulator n=1 Tax=unclassified Mycolicibacterium TaxID=2636767 RepID=UPI0012DE9813|nr:MULTISPECIES: TetR/AcrR family transcriptional regulator [unclassified Mycolicibacterium]MUL80346.1 TetR/AcrR family transcriptional regulator [Mycolicibacterium sp. CBMA 329]MUL86113.1 TetR/AcrR family transcriptional regulator [Mycolicibacterium sp. CBMA 331]MUM00887.1 TetR/AcrR family transcriptional regulator [Mycolicibacterium sp. CBMA 334]MUM26214.1 TetR/AcrR family transcriptional regulator [Mycolicibacterium sp. CBMA 295]MUM36409.1 TetR/AcrR family transcriptional regulator [Mycolic
MTATRQLLARDGYDQLSIEAIAREAGVSRPTIYRRWPSKAHLAFDAAFGQPPDYELLSISGDFETDLRAFAFAVLTFWREPVVEAASLGILAERRRDPELHIRTQQLLDERTRGAFRVLVDSGVQQGRVRTDVDVDMVYQALIGTAFYTAHMEPDSDIDDTADRLCSLLIEGAERTHPRRKDQV